MAFAKAAGEVATLETAFHAEMLQANYHGFG